MTVNDISDCLKSDIIGLKTEMIPIYIQDINENNITGQVLAACELEQLKPVYKYLHNSILFNNLNCFRFFPWLLVIGYYLVIG